MANSSHDHGHGHDDHGHGPAIHVSLREYVIGFLLSVVLTAIPFWLVMSGVIADKQTTGLVITAFAAVQVVVHMVYFLHMSGKVEDGWNLMALLFTILLVAIILAGTLWVMFHLNHNMMPAMPKMDGMG
ncbi:cytochrome o ubiquinol oxidase subunit IV [Novosphingobium sp. FSY-8]|uniref:Cytochrome bo(3) ubiquinol oxidase subunit 4 n=1 Tax=Novosphingobium ovatum TaxID=1908523 RepID=A0ABW9XCH6_9SPHN|nr:cytochrome o ubiquinol oxidase subunit IV [Novosphingobium ovatum]NBC36202.1 cytochrome o ubiquinol oxidase subunit IV [Novosphingobium ovatum]